MSNVVIEVASPSEPKARRPTLPKGLGPKSRKVWRELVAEFVFRADELRILEDACREIDIIEGLNDRLDGAMFFLTGSKGQQVPNPLWREVREHRLALQRLFLSLRLPIDDADGGAKATSAAARDVAYKRWYG